MEDILYRSNPWWTEEFRAPGIPRESYISRLLDLRDTRDVVLITGLRRVGKTTLIYQIIERLLEKESPERIFYVSTDSISLREYSILEIVEEYRRIHSLKHRDRVYLFFDEVHSKKDYELQLKNLYDMGEGKIYASGSSSLDITMKSPYLTGRQRLIRIYPFSFTEFLELRGERITPGDRHLCPRLAEEYMFTGGMPEYIRTGDLNYLQALLDTIIYRDIAGAHGVRNPGRLGDVLSMIAQSVGTPVSLRKISGVLGMSKDEVGRILEWFREANLIYAVEREGKVSERKTAPRKIYLADTGLFAVLTDRINVGAVAENLVYLILMKGGEIRYHRRDRREVDFVRKKDAWDSKYRAAITPDDLLPLKRLRGYENKTLITKNTEGEKDGIRLLPLWRLVAEG